MLGQTDGLESTQLLFAITIVSCWRRCQLSTVRIICVRPISNRWEEASFRHLQVLIIILMYGNLSTCWRESKLVTSMLSYIPRTFLILRSLHLLEHVSKSDVFFFIYK